MSNANYTCLSRYFILAHKICDCVVRLPLRPPSPIAHLATPLCSTHKRTKSCVNHTLMLLTCSFPRLLTRPPFPWLAICLRAAFCPLAQMGLKGRNANQPNLYQRQWGKKICQGPPPVKKDHVGMSVFHKNFRWTLFCVPRSPNTDTRQPEVNSVSARNTWNVLGVFVCVNTVDTVIICLRCWIQEPSV